MKIEVTGDTALVYTPYNADFVKAIKQIGGSRVMRSLSVPI